MDINQHIIQGRLCDDPHVIRTEAGSIARLRVATNRRFRDRNGDWKERGTFHTVIVPSYLVDQISDARKGEGLFVSGYAEDYEYVDNSGQRRFTRQLVAETISRPLQNAAPARSQSQANRDRRPPSPASPISPPSRDFEQPQRSPMRAQQPAPQQRGAYRRQDQSSAPLERIHSKDNYQAPSGGRLPVDDLPMEDEFADLQSQIETLGGSHGHSSH